MIQTWSWNAVTDESVSKFTSAMFHYVEKNWTYQAKYTAIQECTCMNNTSDRHSFSIQRMQYTSLQFTSYYIYIVH